MPGFLSDTREWFRIYKMPDGKPENKFAFDGEYKDADFAYSIIQETNIFWKQLVGLQQPSIEKEKLSISNVTVLGSAENISREEAASVISATPSLSAGPPLDTSVDVWHFNSRL